MEQLLSSRMARLSLFRRNLRAIQHFRQFYPDEYAARNLQNRVKHLFRSRLQGGKPGKRQVAAQEATLILEKLHAALAGDHRAANYVFGFAYGRFGPLRHDFLRPHYHALHDPSLSHPLLNSALTHPNHRRVIHAGPTFPARNEVVQGPLPPSRKKNIFNRWWQNRVLDQLVAPLPPEAVASLTKLARGDFSCSKRRRSKPGMGQQAKIGRRFVQRRAKLLLAKAPVLVQKGGKTVVVAAAYSEPAPNIDSLSLLRHWTPERAPTAIANP